MYCFLITYILAHWRSWAVLELSHFYTLHLAEMPSTLGRIAPFLIETLVGDLSALFISSASVISVLRLCCSAKTQGENHLSMLICGVHVTWRTGVITQCWGLFCQVQWWGSKAYGIKFKSSTFTAVSGEVVKCDYSVVFHILVESHVRKQGKVEAFTGVSNRMHTSWYPTIVHQC